MPQTHLQIQAIPAFNDNYIWLVHDGRQAVVVDPGDAAPVIATLDALHLTLSAIVLTHHHGDHVGGVNTLLQHWQVPVLGPAHDNIACVTQPLSGGQVVQAGDLPLQLTVIDTPGHTAGHICLYAAAQGWLFCGDTLFSAGCGRLFEGTPAQMLSSLQQLMSLPPDTLVFCAHEYTLSNLRFALAADPDNPAVQQRYQEVQALREQGKSSIPVSLETERNTNPFLRFADPAIIRHLRGTGRLTKTGDVATFAALRQWKDTF